MHPALIAFGYVYGVVCALLAIRLGSEGNSDGAAGWWTATMAIITVCILATVGTFP